MTFSHRTIQRFAKGMITRKWVARWFNSRNNTIGCIQAVYRGYVSNKAIRPAMALDWFSSIQIQRICR